MDRQPFSLNILLKNGKKLREYDHTDGNVYIEGRKGSEYLIEVKNNSPLIYKAVMSVDGLNVLSGDKDWSKGYVLYNYNKIEIPGWTKNNSSVASFEFGDAKYSYSNRTNNGTANVGVIGVMLFKEIIPQQIFRGYDPSATRGVYGSSATLSASIANSTAMSKSAEPSSLGTGWGQEQSFNTTKINKEFETAPTATLIMYYDDIKGLEKKGIVLKTGPQAFPDYEQITGCKPPIW